MKYREPITREFDAVAAVIEEHQRELAARIAKLEALALELKLDNQRLLDKLAALEAIIQEQQEIPY